MKNAVRGYVTPNGDVRCQCNKKVGQMEYGVAQFWCNRCDQPVDAVREDEARMVKAMRQIVSETVAELRALSGNPPAAAV